MTSTGIPIHQIQQYLQQLTSQTRWRLLVEMERLQICDGNIPGIDIILTGLRAEFGKSGQGRARVDNPPSYFFQPLEPLLVDRSPEFINAGQISRGSLSAIWEWISQNLLPTMARDYSEKIGHAVTANNPREAQHIAVTFQTKVVKYLESTLAANGGVDRIRTGLAMYTSSRAVFDDLTKMLSVLRARDALAQFNKALQPTISKFESDELAKVRSLLDLFGSKNPDAVPFALTIVANHLKKPWQLVRVATKTTKSKNTSAPATPYVVTISMVLTQLSDKQLALHHALKTNRILVAKDLMRDIYDIEDTLRSRADLLDESDGLRLDGLMEAVAALMKAEIDSLPGNIRHVLGVRAARSRGSLTARLSSLAWKGRRALIGGTDYCKKKISHSTKSKD